MITIPEVVEDIVKKSPLLAEGLARGLINHSAVAREIKKEVEKKVFKDVSDGAIIMSLKRLSFKMGKSKRQHAIFSSSPDMIVRSNLCAYTLKNSPGVISKQKKILEEVAKHKDYFSTITNGVFETTIITSADLKKKVKDIFKDEEKISEEDSLSSITIKLTKEVVKLPGSYAEILRILSWEGINLTEVVSTYLELTIIIREDEVDRAFTALKKNLTQKS